MGRKRKNIEEVKTSKTFRLKPTMWKIIKEENVRLGHKTYVRTLEHIIETYFEKKN